MADAIVNASPLILLSRAGYLTLLQNLSRTVIVPSVVSDEICARENEDPAVQALRSNAWLKVVQAPPPPPEVYAWNLGAGESAVISMGLQTNEADLIIDDYLGRKCARSFGLRVKGTLGIVLRAKKFGEIESARSVMEDLLDSGLYLSPKVLNEALKRVGE